MYSIVVEPPIASNVSSSVESSDDSADETLRERDSLPGTDAARAVTRDADVNGAAVAENGSATPASPGLPHDDADDRSSASPERQNVDCDRSVMPVHADGAFEKDTSHTAKAEDTRHDIGPPAMVAAPPTDQRTAGTMAHANYLSYSSIIHL